MRNAFAVSGLLLVFWALPTRAELAYSITGTLTGMEPNQFIIRAENEINYVSRAKLEPEQIKYLEANLEKKVELEIPTSAITRVLRAPSSARVKPKR